jgi:hypothetical protein
MAQAVRSMIPHPPGVKDGDLGWHAFASRTPDTGLDSRSPSTTDATAKSGGSCPPEGSIAWS